MAALSLALAVCALVAGALPHPGMYVAIGLAIVGMASGGLAWRRRGARGPARLLGAAGLALATLALVLGGARYALTLFAVSRLTGLIGA